MVTLYGGPAEGDYDISRAPLYLRAVVGPRVWKDVLDQLDDEPQPKETIYVYRRGSGGESILFCRNQGVTAFATYEYLPLPGSNEEFRDSATWRQWVQVAVGRAIDPESGRMCEPPPGN